MAAGSAAEREAAGIIAKAARSFMRRAAGPLERGAERSAARDAEGAAARGTEHALTDADRAALKDYTSHHYGELNGYNRNPAAYSASQAADLEARSQAVSDALGKLPAHEGTVFRGTNLTDSQLARYQPGDVVREPAFTSSSATPNVADNFAHGSGSTTAFTIESRTGRSVEPYTEVPGENEVLFDRGTRFKVLGKDLVNGVWRVRLAEVR